MKLHWMFLTGLVLWGLGQRGPDIDLAYRIVGPTPWMIHGGLVLMGLAVVVLVSRLIWARPRYRLMPIVPPARVNRATMVATLFLNDGFMPYQSR